MRAARRKLSTAERERLAGAAEERLRALPAMAAARTVMLFYAFGSELPTRGLAGRLAAEGCGVLLPVVEGERMEAAAWRPGDDLIPTGYGPREPADRTPVPLEEIDVVVAPGLAFDRRGYRLGYGGGHYDRFLARLPDATVRIGLGFHLQLIDEVPHGRNDEPLDAVVTERETVVCRPGRIGPLPP